MTFDKMRYNIFCIFLFLIIWASVGFYNLFGQYKQNMPSVRLATRMKTLLTESIQSNDHKLVENAILKNELEDEESTCECKKKKARFIWKLQDENAINRRNLQWREWKTEKEMTSEQLVACPSFSPITFIGSGLEVEPLQSVQIKGLKFHILFWEHVLKDMNFTLTFQSEKGYGHIGFTDTIDNKKITIVGRNKKKLILTFHKGIDYDTANQIMSQMRYYSKQYHINIRDVVRVQLLTFDANINVHIHRKQFPRLFGITQQSHISEKVTIVTKTFERYRALDSLIRSVRKFYPNITILVADDSEKVQKLNYTNVMHYVMPFGEGWFPGRNLLLSQVQTKYLLWVDDDFIFTENTSLEKMMSRLDDKRWRLDVVAGLINFTTGQKLDGNYNKINIREFSTDGYCLKRRPGSYPLEGNSDCKMADEVINFFMAKTLKARTVGFDLQLKRFGHHEFFWDGLGKMRVAACQDISIFHQRVDYDKHGDYRYQFYHPKTFQNWMLQSVFRNNLYCFNWDEFVPEELLQRQTSIGHFHDP